MKNKIVSYKIAVIGLGYVGLPLFLELSKKYQTIGYDIDNTRILTLKKSKDTNNQINKILFKNKKKQFFFTNKKKDLENCNVYIITVPTPVDKNKNPDLRLLKKATWTVAEKLKRKDIVIFESTVYPGCTEEECIPILEKKSNLLINKDFYVGYSPERVSPGDAKYSLKNLTKVVSGSNITALNKIKKIYEKTSIKEIYPAPSIKVAEAAKITENVQRDLNLSLVNELSLIFSKMNIDTNEVIEAASTKKNFMKLFPGLVGGHCISVDPYYLTKKSEKLGYKPQVILSGRKVNNKMPRYIAQKAISHLKKQNINITKANINIFGLTFKENCKDIRDSRVFDLIDELRKFNVKALITDPLLDKVNINRKYKSIFRKKILKPSDVAIFSVAHNQYKNLKISEIKNKLKNKNSLLIDVKSIFDKKFLKNKKISFWRL